MDLHLVDNSMIGLGGRQHLPYMERKYMKRNQQPTPVVVPPPTIDYSAFHLPIEIVDFKNHIYQKYLEPYNLDIPNYVYKALVLAGEAEDLERIQLLEVARQKAEMHYLGQWAKGNIKVNTEPMPEEVKEKLKEINENKRLEKQAKRIELDNVVKSNVKKPKGKKLPVFSDSEQQKQVLKKYPHAIAGTFKAHPSKAGVTLLDIKCTKCGKSKTISLCEAFHIKTCSACLSK